MKLGDETLVALIEIFRQGILGLKDISDALRELELVQRADGKLYVNKEELTGQGS